MPAHDRPICGSCGATYKTRFTSGDDWTYREVSATEYQQHAGPVRAGQPRRGDRRWRPVRRHRPPRPAVRLRAPGHPAARRHRMPQVRCAMRPDMDRVKRALLLAGLVGTVVAANWAVTSYGVVPVGFGLAAPAGVYLAGLAFTLRDLLHDIGGRWWVLAAIAAGAAVSVAVAPPALAVASGLAFAVSELADMAVYTPLRERRWLLAVAASNVVGLIVDSVLFLAVAFGSLAFLPGQLVGKAWITVVAVMVLAAFRRRRRVAVA